MPEYIEKNEFFDAIRAEFYDRMPTGSEVISRMLKFPAADVRENVKARWEEDILDGLPGYRPVVIVCSNCHLVSMAEFSYCPNCGAQMEVQDG